MVQARLDEGEDASQLPTAQLIEWVRWVRYHHEAQIMQAQAAIHANEQMVLKVTERACIDANARASEFKESARLYTDTRDNELELVKRNLLSEIAQLNAEVATSKTHHQNNLNELKQMRSRFIEAAALLKELEEATEHAHREHDRLSHEHESTKHTLSDLQAKGSLIHRNLLSDIAQLNAEVASLNVHNENNLKALRESKETTAHLHDENGRLSRKQKEMEEFIAELNAEKSSVERNLLSKMAQLKAKVASALKELKESEVLMAERAERADNADREKDKLCNALYECQSARGVGYATLTSEINDIESQCMDAALPVDDATFADRFA